MVLQLYGRDQSSSTERVRIALALKDLSYEAISVDDIGWDAYERINPQRLVPTLAEDDQLIPQSNAILHYLEEQFPELPLLPSDPVLRAQSRSLPSISAANCTPSTSTGFENICRTHSLSSSLNLTDGATIGSRKAFRGWKQYCRDNPRPMISVSRIGPDGQKCT